ncbi:MAG: hypothetical protein ABJA67_06465 [Chthonomonadales bacterium]
MHIGYDPRQLTGVDVLFEGTASRFITHYRVLQPPEIGGVALDGNLEIDLSNPILFTNRFSVVDTSIDTTFLRWTVLDIPTEFGVDQIVADPGWIRIARPLVDIRTHFIGAKVSNDSAFDIPVSLLGNPGARIQAVRVTVPMDTALWWFDSLTTDSGSKIVDTGLVVSKTSISWTSILKDSGQYLELPSLLGRLRLHAKTLRDTVCAPMFASAIQVMNREALIRSALSDTADICISGTGSTQAVNAERANAIFSVWPNPAATKLHFDMSRTAGLQRLKIYDFIGHLAFETQMVPPWTWNIPSDLASGWYDVTVSELGEDELSSVSSSVAHARFLLIH